MSFYPRKIVIYSANRRIKKKINVSFLQVCLNACIIAKASQCLNLCQPLDIKYGCEHHLCIRYYAHEEILLR